MLEGLQPQPGGKYIDGTLGAGGHARGVLAASGPNGQLLGLDRDPAALAVARTNLAEFGARTQLVHASYVEMATVAQDFAPVDGILLDLGLSSLQLAAAERGFAFQHAGPLDMRFDPSTGALTAADIVNTWAVDEIANILFEYGEERESRRIARAIVAARPLTTTQQLAEVVSKALRHSAAQQRPGEARPHTHPATRTFQALRMAVNEELEAIAKVLPTTLALLKPGGRLAIIAFHSLEDRLVKNFMRAQARGPATDPTQPTPAPFVPTLVEITRKPVVASDTEVAHNPRARSAKLRVAEKV